MVVSKIMEGLKDASVTSLLMKNGDFTEIKPEYLLTTLVAKQLVRDNPDWIVKLEEKTSIFASSCVPQFIGRFDLASSKNVTRKGKIDIAVYSSKPEGSFLNLNKALFPIELKGINPIKSLFLSDVTRNLEYFMLEDNKTGKSFLQEAFCGSVEAADRFLFKEDIDEFIEKIRGKYNKWLEPHRDACNHTNIEINVHVNEIMSQLYSREDEFDTSEGDSEWDFMQDWHLYVGVVVEMRRK